MGVLKPEVVVRFSRRPKQLTDQFKKNAILAKIAFRQTS